MDRIELERRLQVARSLVRDVGQQALSSIAAALRWALNAKDFRISSAVPTANART
jgi:hypothetical protein